MEVEGSRPKDAILLLDFELLYHQSLAQLEQHFAELQRVVGRDLNREEQLNDLLDDIVASVHADPTRGGNAIQTTIISNETDENDHPASHQRLRPQGSRRDHRLRHQ